MSKLDELISGKQSELDKLKTELLRAKIENEKLKKSQFQENHEWKTANEKIKHEQFAEKLDQQKDKNRNALDLQSEKFEFQKHRYRKAQRDKWLMAIGGIVILVIVIIVAVCLSDIGDLTYHG